jgi:2-polyprenyl-3-methyl-5-hydroxy-6-metoxy-1,4-benzoquinol methylase
MNQVGSFLRTGQGLQYHDWMQPREWNLYQNGMESTAQMLSRLAAAKIRISGSASLLDIGGAHGLYSIELLKKNAGLKAEILDLPEAVAVHADKLNAYPNRLTYTAGNILTDDLPKEKYDVVIMANVAHHFTEIENIAVAKKVFDALKPGGSFYILEFFQKDMAASAKDMIGALQSFFFSFSSTSGLWSANAIKNWLQQANFTRLQIKPFLQLPGFGLVTGKKG